MVDGGVDAPPPVKRKRGRPRKADVLAAQQAALAATGGDGSIVPAVNGVPAASLAKPEPKPRKSRKKKGEIPPPAGVDMQLVGKNVTGVLDGHFDAGYLLSVRVQNTDGGETILRGVVFGPGLTVPIHKSIDVAQGVKNVKRDESIVPPAASPISVLAAPGAPPPAFATQSAPPATTAAVPFVAPPTVTPKALPTPPVVAAADLNSPINSTQSCVQTVTQTVQTVSVASAPAPVAQTTPAA